MSKRKTTKPADKPTVESVLAQEGKALVIRNLTDQPMSCAAPALEDATKK